MMLFDGDRLCIVFFFKQKTAYEMRISDWSSDVCSSDLDRLPSSPAAARPGAFPSGTAFARPSSCGETSALPYRGPHRPAELGAAMSGVRRTASWQYGGRDGPE